MDARTFNQSADGLLDFTVSLLTNLTYGNTRDINDLMSDDECTYAVYGYPDILDGVSAWLSMASAYCEKLLQDDVLPYTGYGFEIDYSDCDCLMLIPLLHSVHKKGFPAIAADGRIYRISRSLQETIVAKYLGITKKTPPSYVLFISAPKRMEAFHLTLRKLATGEYGDEPQESLDGYGYFETPGIQGKTYYKK
jgi:hypothetical protein